MNDLVPRQSRGFLAARADRQFTTALSTIEQQAAITEAAADRRMQSAALLSHNAKLHVASAVGMSRQLKEVVPEASDLFDTFDVGLAMNLQHTIKKAVG
jgi:hypothetical protein